MHRVAAKGTRRGDADLFGLGVVDAQIEIPAAGRQQFPGHVQVDRVYTVVVFCGRKVNPSRGHALSLLESITIVCITEK